LAQVSLGIPANHTAPGQTGAKAANHGTANQIIVFRKLDIAPQVMTFVIILASRGS
jgi:hypothetical protein